MKKEVLRLFNQAESFRTVESREFGLKELCDKMAYEAGWHTVYTPGNRSKIKDKVHYDRAFNDILFFELLSRFKKPIIKQFGIAGSLDSEKTEEKIYDVILRYMSSYNPDKVVSNSMVTARMVMSIRQRAIECNFESNTINSVDSSKVNVKNENGEIIGLYCLSPKGSRYFTAFDGHTVEEVERVAKEQKIQKPDWRCRQCISLESTIKVGKNQDEKSLEDYLAAEDQYEKAEFKADYENDMIDLENKYANNDSQKILLRILIDLGEKTSPAKLLNEYAKEIGKPAEDCKKEVFSFYRKLKIRLAAAYN